MWTRARSYNQILSVNLCYAHFSVLLLVEIFEQPMILLKNKRRVILRIKYLYRIGPRDNPIRTFSSVVFVYTGFECSDWFKLLEQPIRVLFR